MALAEDRSTRRTHRAYESGALLHGAVPPPLWCSGRECEGGMAERWRREGGSGLEWVDLSEVTRAALCALDPPLPRLSLDVELAVDLPEAIADAQFVAECVSRLLCSAVHAVGDDWGYVSVGTAPLTRPGHAIAAGAAPRRQADPHRVCLEVQTTGSALSAGAPRFSTDPLPAPGFGPLALSKARGYLRSFGGELDVDPWATAGACAWLTLTYLGAALG